jgi:integrase
LIPMGVRGSVNVQKARRATAGKEAAVMARRRYQAGCLFKRGKRRKVWVARWREDVLVEGDRPGRLHRSVVLGTVAELPTKRHALTRLEEQLRPINQGTGRPEGSMRFEAFAEGQWSALVLPTLKLSTQHGYRTVLAKHVLPYWREWRLRDIGKQDVQQFVGDKFQQKLGWQTVRNAWTLLSGIFETAVEYGYLTVNPARGVKFPQQALREAPALISGNDFARLLDEVDEPYRMMIGLIAATGLRIGELLALRWRALDLEIGTLRVLESVSQGTFQRPKTQKARRTIPLGPHASIQTTLNIYTHVVDASHRDAIEALERQLFPTVPKSQEEDTSGNAGSAINKAG